jgi:hypothetical protein
VLRGFLAELWQSDRQTAQDLLDSALDRPALLQFLPIMHSAVQIDERGVERLKRALRGGQIPAPVFQHLAYGGTPDHVPAADLKDLLRLIAAMPDGFEVALEILYMRLFSDRSAQRVYQRELIEAGRELLQSVTFRGGHHRVDHELAAVVTACLTGSEGSPVAAMVGLRLRDAVAAHMTYSFDNDDVLKALLQVQPISVLNAIFGVGVVEERRGLAVFERLGQHAGNPADALSSETLLAWCEEDAGRRYPLAAAIITFSYRPEASGPELWSEQATALLSRAPDPQRVLSVFVRRFRPMTWSGSRATLMESSAGLLDRLEMCVPPSVMPFVDNAKTELAREVAREREEETRHDRVRDERFEN